ARMRVAGGSHCADRLHDGLNVPVRARSAATRARRRGRRAAPGRAIAPTGAMPSPDPAKFDEDDVGQANPRRIGQGRFGAVFALGSLAVVEAAGDVAAVQRGAERAEIDEEEPAALRIAPEA